MGNDTNKAVVSLVSAIASAFLKAWFIMLLWNWLIPLIFGLVVIGYWEAMGLFLLCGFLFKRVDAPIKQ